MSGTGDIPFRLRFDERRSVDDGAGNVLNEWRARFTVWAGIFPMKGGEEVLAGRLAGTQPAVVRVRKSCDTRAITTEWRAVDVNSGQVYAVTSPPVDMAGNRLYLEMIATLGVSP